MSTIGARLDHLHLLSPQPERLVDFYQGVMGMPAERVDPTCGCARRMNEPC